MGSVSLHPEYQNSYQEYSLYKHLPSGIIYASDIGMDWVNIKVFDVIRCKFCVATEDGEKIYNEIFRNLNKKKKIMLSFSGINLIMPAFLNASICQLYRQFDEDVIDNNLIITDLKEEDRNLLRIHNHKAKRYFKNPTLYDKFSYVSFGENDA